MKKIFVSFGILLFILAGCKKEEVSPADDDNGNGTTEEVPIQGNWLFLSEESFPGPNEASCNAVYMEIQKDEFKILSFLDSDPAAGLKGTYEYSQADTFLMSYVDWNDSLYNWKSDLHEWPLHLTVSPDNDTLYVDGKLPAQRITTSLPPALVGTWEIPEYATMTIETTGAFEWVATETEGVMEQSGNGQSIGTYNGDNFLLFNITYCDYEEGENDYYTLNRYELVGTDSVTIWHGEESFGMAKN